MIGSLTRNYYWTDKIYNRKNRKQLFMFKYRMQRLFTGYNYKFTPSFPTLFFKPLKKGGKKEENIKWKFKRVQKLYHKRLRKSMNFVFTHVKSFSKKVKMRKKLLLINMRKNARLWAQWAPFFRKDPLLIHNEFLLYNSRVIKFLWRFRDGLHSLLLSLLFFKPFSIFSI